MVELDNKETTNESKESKEDTLFIRFNIIGDIKEKFLYVKEKLGLRYNMEVFRFLVKNYYDEIKLKE